MSLKRHIQADEIAARGAADQFFLCLHTGDKETIQKRLDQLMADINSFSQHTDIRYYLTILQGACVVEDPAADVTIWQDRARMACKLPVSYTHLDVYKRQELPCAAVSSSGDGSSVIEEVEVWISGKRAAVSFWSGKSFPAADIPDVSP